MPEIPTQQPLVTWKDIDALRRDITSQITQQNEKREQMELRILAEIRKLACADDVNALEKEVDDLKKNVYGLTGLNTALAVVGSILAGIFGKQQ